MKKTLIILALLVPSMTFASVDVNVKYGQSGNEVLELQDFLVDKGFLKTNPTGYFGLLTLKAVQEYQTSVGLPNTGYVGVLTRGKINDELNAVVAKAVEAEVAETGTTTPIINLNQPVRGVTEPTQTTMTTKELNLATMGEVYVANDSNSFHRDQNRIDFKLNDATYALVSIVTENKNTNDKPVVNWVDMRKTANYTFELDNWFMGKVNWKVKSYSDIGIIGETSGTFEIK